MRKVVQLQFQRVFAPWPGALCVPIPGPGSASINRTHVAACRL